MIETDPLRRRRTIEAMGLGPVWVRRQVATIEGEAPVVAPVVAAAAEDRPARIATLAWEPLQEAVGGCVACGLCETRTQTVFGIGARHPDWLIVGEAPGADEDAKGEPFVGPAGKLLDAMLTAVGFSRHENAYILNVVKCRPPGNRNPAPDEVASCRPFLERQIELLAPKMILIVGKVASSVLLGGEPTMRSLRGKEHRVRFGGRDIPVVATYHPAYLLRSLGEKAEAWADLCFARTVYERVVAEALP